MEEPRIYRTFPATIALLAAAAFLPALLNNFVNWDDWNNFLQNQNYRGLGWFELRWMWTSHLMGHYIPITWMTLGFDYLVWDLNPAGYHLTSILFHAANAVVFYFVAMAILRLAVPSGSVEMRERIPVAAFFAALFFAVHPLRVESVAWATERRDMVSGLFYLLAILAYLRGARDTASGPMRGKFYWASLACFVLALLAKELTLTLPLVLLILDVYPLRRLGGGPGRWFGRGARGVWIEKIPMFALSAADGLLVLWIGTDYRTPTPLGELGWFHRLAISVYGVAFYLWKTAAPFHLAPFYAITVDRVNPRGLPFELSAVAVLLCISAAILFRRTIPGLAAAGVTYVIVLLPVLQIFTSGSQIVADRYSYLSCLGIAVLAGAGLLWLWKMFGRVVVVAATLAVCGLGFLSWRQTQVWRDSETLWTYDVSVEPSFLAWNNLGEMRSMQGDVPSAVEYYRRAVEMNPNYAYGHNNLGLALIELKDPDDAVREFEAAIKLSPELSNPHYGLGRARLMQGRVDEAISEFETTLRLNPSDDFARDDLKRARASK